MSVTHLWKKGRGCGLTKVETDGIGCALSIE